MIQGTLCTVCALDNQARQCQQDNQATRQSGNKPRVAPQADILAESDPLIADHRTTANPYYTVPRGGFLVATVDERLQYLQRSRKEGANFTPRSFVKWTLTQKAMTGGPRTYEPC